MFQILDFRFILLMYCTRAQTHSLQALVEDNNLFAGLLQMLMFLFKFRDFAKKSIMNYRITSLNFRFIINVIIIVEKSIKESIIKILS